MPFPDFDPVLFSIGPFALRWYALAYVAGILLGWWYGVRLANTPRIWDARGPAVNKTQIDDLILWITVGIVLGGRLGYVLFYMLPDAASRASLAADPLSLFAIWRGGMSFHGGIIGVSLALLIYAWRNKIDLLRLADQTAPCAPFGLLFGRLANFINGELWGRTTEVPWGVVFCNRTIEAANGGACPAGYVPRHPSQLYEAALEGVVIWLVLRWATHAAHKLPQRGFVAGMFLLLYGLFRIGSEMVREPDRQMPEALQGYVTMGGLLSIPMILGGLYLIWRSRRERPVEAAPESAQPAA